MVIEDLDSVEIAIVGVLVAKDSERERELTLPLPGLSYQNCTPHCIASSLTNSSNTISITVKHY